MRTELRMLADKNKERFITERPSYTDLNRCYFLGTIDLPQVERGSRVLTVNLEGHGNGYAALYVVDTVACSFNGGLTLIAYCVPDGITPPPGSVDTWEEQIKSKKDVDN